jgi:hypothetical protein
MVKEGFVYWRCRGFIQHERKKTGLKKILDVGEDTTSGGYA